jgi:hypothetical protein
MSILLLLGAAVLAFAVVMGVFFVIARVLDRPDVAIEDRLDQFVSREIEDKVDLEEGAERRRSGAG